MGGYLSLNAALLDQLLTRFVLRQLREAMVEEEVRRNMVGELARNVAGSAPGAGFAEVLGPGDPERDTRAIRTRDGIPLPAEVWQGFSTRPPPYLTLSPWRRAVLVASSAG